jgi:hypothetical protein
MTWQMRPTPLYPVLSTLFNRQWTRYVSAGLEHMVQHEKTGWAEWPYDEFSDGKFNLAMCVARSLSQSQKPSSAGTQAFPFGW